MSGGASSVIADVAIELGMSLPQPDVALAEGLTEFLPDAATVANPLDVTAAAMVDWRILTSAAERMMETPLVDIVLVQLTTNADPVAADMARALIELRQSASKPLIVSRLGSPELAPRAMAMYRAASVPVLTWPDDAARVAWAVARAGELVSGVSTQQEVASAP
jgi:acyl-CoA synthetase (NDP forming)